MNLVSEGSKKSRVVGLGALVVVEEEEVRKDGKEGQRGEWVRTNSYRCWVNPTSAIWGHTPNSVTLHPALPSTYLSVPLNTFQRRNQQRRSDHR